MKKLIVTFDVGALTDDQIDSLSLAVEVQAEAYDESDDPARNYPDVPVVSTVVSLEA